VGLSLYTAHHDTTRRPIKIIGHRDRVHAARVFDGQQGEKRGRKKKQTAPWARRPRIICVFFHTEEIDFKQKSYNNNERRELIFQIRTINFFIYVLAGRRLGWSSPEYLCFLGLIHRNYYAHGSECGRKFNQGKGSGAI